MSEEHPPAPPSTKEDTPPSTPTTKLVSYSSLDELVTSEKTVKDPTEIAMPVNCEIEPLGFLFKTPRKVFHNGKEKFSSPIHRFAGVLRRKLSGDVVWSERLFHMVRPRTCPRLLRYALKCLEESDSGCTSQYFESPSESLRLPRRWSLKGGSSSSKLPKSYSAEKTWMKKSNRSLRKKSLTHKISSGIRAFKLNDKKQKEKEIEKQDQGGDARNWTLTWYDVDSKLGSLYNYVLHMSRFYDPTRLFPMCSVTIGLREPLSIRPKT